MPTIQDRLTLLLRKNRTVYFCDGCLALKMGVFPREVRDAFVAIGQCSECLQTGSIIRALAA